MSQTHQEAAARLRAHLDQPHAAPAALDNSDIRLLLDRLEALERDHEDLQRQSAKAMEMFDAATAFLRAYGEKYRNFASGGIRPTAILQSEVKIMWAIFKEFRTLTESDEPADPVRELWPRRTAGSRF